MMPRLPALLAVLLGSLSLAAPSAQSASFGDEHEDEDRRTQRQPSPT